MAEPQPQKQRPTEVPIKLIKFRDDQLMDIPGSTSSTLKGVVDPTKSMQARHVITWVPQERHYRIEFYEAGNDGKGTPSKEFDIQETFVWLREKA